MIMTLRTQFQKERQKKREEVYAEYRKLLANPDNMPSAIIQHLMRKYNIGAASTIYGIIKEHEGNERN
jgi:hypothetical protein